MTHVLIAADLVTVGLGILAVIVFVALVGAASTGQIRPGRRNNRSRGFWRNNEPDYQLFGQTGLLHQPDDANNDTFLGPNPLSIYEPADDASHSTEIGGAGSILGLNSETNSSSVSDSGGYGGLGSSAGEFLNLDDSGGGGSFDSGDYSSDSSFSDNSGGGSYGSDN